MTSDNWKPHYKIMRVFYKYMYITRALIGELDDPNTEI